MARKFVAQAILDFGSLAALNGAAQLSASCWAIFPSGQDGIYRGIFGNGDATLSNGFAMRVQGTTGGALFDLANGADTAFQANPATIPFDAWFHACMVFDGAQTGNANRLKVYINGAPAAGGFIGTIPATVGAGGHLVVNNVGVGFSSAPSTLAECAVWNAALTAAEVAALAKGVSARRVRPAALAFYAPIFGLQLPEPELSGLNVGGSVIGVAPVFANHPPVALFTPKRRRWADLVGSTPRSFAVPPRGGTFAVPGRPGPFIVPARPGPSSCARGKP